MRLRSARDLAPFFVAMILSATPALGDSALSDDFNEGSLDFTTWCPCQINLSKSPYTFPTDPGDSGDHMLSIPVDRHSLGGNKCHRVSECTLPLATVSGSEDTELDGSVESETLGPTFFDDEGPGILGIDPTERNPYCTAEVTKEALAAHEEDECFQRQEIRMQEEKAHPATERYIYEIRFRMPAAVADQTNSIRWVIGQWKQDRESPKYAAEFGEAWGASPEGAICSSGLSLKYGRQPVLASPAGRFVDMKYVVQADRNSPARIDIFQNGRLIVTVSGKIGYDVDPSSPPVSKFKIGHYRDYMPHDYVMDIDRISVQKEAAP